MNRMAGNEKRCFKTIRGDVLKLTGIFVVADGLDFLKPGVIAPRGRLFHQATCPS
jgi:hypothetical protein